MNKKGLSAELGIFFLIGVLIVGGISAHQIISENRFIGDKTTLLYYDLKTCDGKEISRENILDFKTLEEAKENGYQPAKCSS